MGYYCDCKYMNKFDFVLLIKKVGLVKIFWKWIEVDGLDNFLFYLSKNFFFCMVV